MLRRLLLTGALMIAATIAPPATAQTVIPPAAGMEGSAEAVAERLWQVMQLSELMPILRDEAVSQADEMAEIMFQRGGQGGWNDAVARIHDPERLEGLFRAGLDRALAGRDRAEVAAAVAFYETPLGRQLLRLETSARRAMLAEGAEDDAKSAFAAAASRNAPRVKQIQQLLDRADLVEPNVAGALNAALAFSQGFSEGGGYRMPMSEGQILAQVAAQEPEIRAETLGWMEAYLMLAYSPLSDADLAIYTEFSASPEGQALSSVLFAAFDGVFRQAARDMGFTAAGQMEGRAL